MLLTEKKYFTGGSYQIFVTTNGGTVDLNMSIDDQAAQTIPDGSFSADTVQQMDIGNCYLEPVITGGATISIEPIPTYIK